MNHKQNSVLVKLALICVVGSAGLVATNGCSKSAMRDLPFLSFGKNDDALTDKGSGTRTEGKNTFAKNMAESLQTKTLTIWHDSFEDAKTAAAETGKPILADFTGSDWCHWCVKLKKDVFETAEFKNWARDNVTLLELDYPRRSAQPPAIKKQNAELSKKYNISGYPTVLFLTSEGEVMGKLGYNESPTQWISNAKSILKQNPQSNQFAQ